MCLISIYSGERSIKLNLILFRRYRPLSRLPQDRVQRREHRVLDRMRRLQVHQQRAEARRQGQKDLLGLRSDRITARSQPRHRDPRPHRTENPKPFVRHLRPRPEADHRPHGEGLLPALPRVRPLQEPHLQQPSGQQ